MAELNNLDEYELDQAAGKASLQSREEEEEAETKDLLVRGVPVAIYKTLKTNGFTFAGYAKMAVQEKMKRDGLL